MQALVGQSADAARSVREAAEAKLSRELDAALAALATWRRAASNRYSIRTLAHPTLARP